MNNESRLIYRERRHTCAMPIYQSEHGRARQRSEHKREEHGKCA